MIKFLVSAHVLRDERKIILNNADKFINKSNDNNARIYELNGIVEGIVCDGEVNKQEVCRIKSGQR